MYSQLQFDLPLNSSDLCDLFAGYSDKKLTIRSKCATLFWVKCPSWPSNSCLKYTDPGIQISLYIAQAMCDVYKLLCITMIDVCYKNQVGKCHSPQVETEMCVQSNGSAQSTYRSPSILPRLCVTSTSYSV